MKERRRPIDVVARGLLHLLCFMGLAKGLRTEKGRVVTGDGSLTIAAAIAVMA